MTASDATVLSVVIYGVPKSTYSCQPVLAASDLSALPRGSQTLETYMYRSPCLSLVVFSHRACRLERMSTCCVIQDTTLLQPASKTHVPATCDRKVHICHRMNLRITTATANHVYVCSLVAAKGQHVVRLVSMASKWKNQKQDVGEWAVTEPTQLHRHDPMSVYVVSLCMHSYIKSDDETPQSSALPGLTRCLRLGLCTREQTQ